MSTSRAAPLRIATRESALALAQTHWVAAQLKAHDPALAVEIVGFTTQGDRILDRPLADIGGKGLFIKELETALEQGHADIAVHSMKDVPMELPPGFALTVVGAREDVGDAFVSNRFDGLDSLPAGSVVGTSSLRRESALRHFYPHLRVASLRGNVNTRLRKLDEGQYDAIVLAAAGLRRLGMAARIRQPLDLARFIPAIAQGALGIEYRAGDTATGQRLAVLAAAETTLAVSAERAFGRRLSASCDVPLGALARVTAGRLVLRGFVALPDGSGRIESAREDAADTVHTADALGTALAEDLLARGADRILDTLAARHARP